MKKCLYILPLFLLIASFPLKAACLKSPKGTLRVGPGPQFKMLWEIGLYSPVKIIEQRKAWLKVEDADGVQGWIETPKVSQDFFCGSVKYERVRMRHVTKHKRQKVYAFFDQNFKIIKFQKRGILALSQTGKKFILQRRDLWVQ